MKKTLLAVLALSLTAFAFADELDVKDYNYRMSDLAGSGYTKEEVFSRMNRDFIKSDSICANRAHMWAFDFKRAFDLDAAKLFVFYTDKVGNTGATNWWYHVAPMIAENGKAYVMDAGFSLTIKGPVSKEQWLTRFTGTPNCKEINAGEDELIQKMFTPKQFPKETSYGTNDCYYKIVPAGYWFPSGIAMNLLGKDAKGNPVSYSREEILRSEVYSACVEAVTSDTGRQLGGGKKQCKKYLQL